MEVIKLAGWLPKQPFFKNGRMLGGLLMDLRILKTRKKIRKAFLKIALNECA
jgi:hypothetical protein